MKLELGNIDKRPDATVLLDDQPYPHSVTRLEIETDIQEHGDPALEPIVQEIRSRTLRLYDGERVIAATAHYQIDPESNVVRLRKDCTTFY